MVAEVSGGLGRGRCGFRWLGDGRMGREKGVNMIVGGYECASKLGL